MIRWDQRVARLRTDLCRNLTLDELINLAREHEMTEEEIEAQRESWIRGEVALGLDAAEAAYRKKLKDME